MLAVATGVVTARALADEEAGGPGLGRRARQRAASWLRPRSLITLAPLAARTVLVAAAVSGPWPGAAG
ncbi:MAG TPA: hypothetical protein VKB57_17440 [Acidimicrobiales bacterium]|nr:hypothetical protein [Acidimicrobiales bacterium]